MFPSGECLSSCRRNRTAVWQALADIVPGEEAYGVRFHACLGVFSAVRYRSACDVPQGLGREGDVGAQGASVPNETKLAASQGRVAQIPRSRSASGGGRGIQSLGRYLGLAE